MPKWKDFTPTIKMVATFVNPLAGVGVSVLEGMFKTKKKVKDMIDGKKTYIGLAITFAATVAKLLGYEVPVEATEGVTTSLTQILQSFGGFMIAIGLVHKLDKKGK